MAADETFKIAFEGILNDSAIRDLANQVGDSMVKGTTEGSKRAQKAWTELVMAGTKAGLEGGILRGGKKLSTINDRLLDANKLANEMKRAIDAGDAHAIAGVTRRMKMETAALERVADRRDDHMKEHMRLQRREFHEVADDFGSKLGGVLSGIGPGDLGGMVKGLGKTMRRKGDVAATKGAEGDSGAMVKAMGKAGKAMQFAGKMMMGLGATVGVVVMLVKAFIDLDSKIKDMNASIVGTAGAADFALGGTAYQAGAKFGSQLKNIRKEIIENSAADKNFRESAEDTFGVLGAMNEANYRFRDMREEIESGTSAMENYADITSHAIGYSKLLGVDMRQMGTDAATLANEWGTGLETIYEGFGMIHREAMMSGFSVKRFYSTVLEVTSGMGMYNVRVEEAAGLLRTLGNVLGETVGGEFLKSISTGFKDMSTQDRMAEVIKRGGPGNKALKDIMSATAENNARSLFDKIGKDTLKKAGVEAETPEEFIEAMRKMSPKKRLELRGELSSAGVEPELLTKFSQMGDQFMASTGNFAAMTEAMKSMGPRATLAMLRKPGGPFGGKSVSEIIDEAQSGGGSPEMIAALEAIASAGGVSISELREFDEGLRADFAQIEKLSEEALKGDTEARKVLLDQYGLAYDEDKKLRKVTLDPTTGAAVFGDEVKDIEDIIMGQGPTQEDQLDMLTKDQELATQIASNTKGLENVIKDNMLMVLNRIYDSIVDIYQTLLEYAPKWMGGEERDRERAKAGAATRLTSEEQKVTRKIAEYQTSIEDAQKRLATEDLSPEEKEAVAAEITAYTKAQGQLERMYGDIQKTKHALGSIEAGHEDVERYIQDAAKKAGISTVGGEMSSKMRQQRDTFYEQDRQELMRDFMEEHGGGKMGGKSGRKAMAKKMFAAANMGAYAAGPAFEAAIADAEKAVEKGGIKTRGQFLEAVRSGFGAELTTYQRQQQSREGLGGIESEVAKNVAAARAKSEAASEARREKEAAAAKEKEENRRKLLEGSGGTTVNLDVTVNPDGTTATATTDPDDADLILDDD